MCENPPLVENRQSEIHSRRMNMCLTALAIGLFLLFGVWALAHPRDLGIPQYPLTLVFKEKYQNNNKGFSGLHQTKETENVKLDHVEDSTQLNEELLEKKFRLPRDVSKQDEKQYPTLIRIPRDAKGKDTKKTSTTKKGAMGNDSKAEDTKFKPIESANYEDADDIFGDDYEPCPLPTALKTAEILCKSWNEIVICKSYCAYGYTYNEGIVRSSICSMEDDTWSNEFEECEPFVDCKVKMISPGSLNCIQNRLAASPSCDIQCIAYDDHKAVASQRYNCRSDGTWIPALPFCVALRGTKLVRAPEVTEHADISYPARPNMKFEDSSVKWLLYN